MTLDPLKIEDALMDLREDKLGPRSTNAFINPSFVTVGPGIGIVTDLMKEVTRWGASGSGLEWRCAAMFRLASDSTFGLTSCRASFLPKIASRANFLHSIQGDFTSAWSCADAALAIENHEVDIGRHTIDYDCILLV